MTGSQHPRSGASVKTEPPTSAGVALDSLRNEPRDGLTSPLPTAVIAWHGMGQQLRFETIESIALSLARREGRRWGQEPEVRTRLVKFGEEQLWRAELDLRDADNVKHPVHVYEAYWAPLTEGKITLGETVRFLIATALGGLRYAVRSPRVLIRYLFGSFVEFPLKASLAAAYVLLLAAFAVLLLVNFVTTTTLTVKVLTDPGNAARWPSYALLNDLTLDLAWLAAAFVALITIYFVAYQNQKRHWRDATPSKRRQLPRLAIWLLIGSACAVTLGVGAALLDHLILHSAYGPLLPSWLRWERQTVTGVPDAGTWAQWRWLLVSAFVWVTVLAGSIIVRWFVVEFVGDVAIYTSSHTLNRFHEARQQIRDRSHATTRAIYEHGQYDRHILVGHSLGSVIAYDTLNRLVNDDKVEPGRLQVVRRTALLVTFGSVLDKVAFLFRAQSNFGDLREVFAAAGQPLISDPQSRPRWVNIYSSDDILGGSLEYYDPLPRSRQPPGNEIDAPGRINNLKDPNAWIPVLAHSQYWTNDPLLETLRAAVTGAPVMGT